MQILLQAQLRHRNFIASIHSLLQVGTINEKDILLQMARCSFDMHMQEIVGTLIVGATVVMLQPHGNMDFKYLIRLLTEKQITYMLLVTKLLHSLLDFLKRGNRISALEFLRSLCTGGERSSNLDC